MAVHVWNLQLSNVLCTLVKLLQRPTGFGSLQKDDHHDYGLAMLTSCSIPLLLSEEREIILLKKKSFIYIHIIYIYIFINRHIDKTKYPITRGYKYICRTDSG